MHHQQLLTDNELQQIKNRARLSKVSKYQEGLKNCECCDTTYVPQALPLLCQVEEFAHIGLLYPLYFKFIMYIGVYLVLATLFSAFNVHFNNQGSSCGISSSFSCQTSITNLVQDEENQDSLNQQSITNYLFIFMSVVYLEIMCSVLKKDCTIMKEKSYAESDYGVILKGVKSDRPVDVLNEIKHLENRYFQNTGKSNKIVRFAKLSDMKAYSDRQQQLIAHSSVDQKLQHPQDQLTEKKSQAVRFTSYSDTQHPIPFTTNQLKELSKQNHFSGKVIIFFEYPIKLSEIEGSNLEHLTDASDIIWENIGLQKEQNKGLWMLIGTVLLMCAAFLTILALKLWIKTLSLGERVVTTTFLNLMVATVVAVFNSIEGIVIRYCARKQLYGTHSKFFTIVARRLSYIFFINMVMTTFFSNLVIGLWSDDYTDAQAADKILPLNYTGLVTDFFFLFITNSYISSIFNYFDLFYGVKLFRRHKIQTTRKRNHISNDELNFIFEGHPVDMGLRYGNIMKTLFFTAFISPFVPIGTIFSFAGIVICYWVDKYLLLTRYVCRYQLCPNFAKQMSEFSKFYVVLFAFSNVLLQMMPISKDDQLEQSSNWDLFVSIGVFFGTLVYKFVLTTCKRILFKKKAKKNYSQDKRYDNVKKYFRNCFQTKLNVYDVSQLLTNDEQAANTCDQIDQKLMQSVRISTIQRVIELYP